ncbi:MAG: right-handed parallel beta-helix repeat-containing protein, partial [Pseudomonadota bacterium]
PAPRRAGLAPRVLAAALDGFRPEAEGALDPDGTGAVAGAIAGDGTFKGDLFALPAVQPLPWGIATWGLDRMVSGIGWGAIPEQADTAFKVQPTRLSGPAPMAVHVQLKGIDRDERLVDDVLWDFEEDYEYDVLPLESRARRTSRYGSGYVSGHVYRTPGTYTITATHRTRLGHERSTSIAVTALDPDTVYPGADTVCVSTLGDFTGAPAGALQAASVAEVIALRPGTSGPRRVLFRRGEEIYLSDSFSQRTNDYFGAFGPVEDGKPHLRRDANSAGAGHFRSGGGADIIVTGLEMSDSYDAADPVPASEHPEQAVLYTGYSAVNSHTRSTITDCTMRGMRIMVQLSFSTAISNCYFTDWYDYGCLGTAVKTLIIGNRIAQNPDAADFLDGKTANSGVTPNGADHGPVRCGRTEQTVVANNHLESWNGWTIGIAADGSSRSVHQPCLRLLVTNTPTARESAVVTGNHLVGGITQLAVQQNSAPTQPLVPNTGTLIDGNFFENNGNVARAIQLAYPTSAVRNNIFHSRDIADNIANGISSFAVLFASDTSAEGLASRRDVVSNTVLLETAKPDKTFEISRNSGTPYPALDQRNNAVSVAGYGNAGDFPAIAPLDNFHPAPGSALVDGAIGTAPVRDYRLSLRDAVASTGALAPFTAREIDVTAGGGVPLAGAVTTGGMLTLAARVARDGSGTRQVLGVGGDGLELLSPSGRMRLALRLDDGSVLVDTTLDGLAAEGDFVSVMLAVDLAGGLTGGRTVSLWVDGAEVYSQPVAARPALADLSGAVLMGGTAAARLAQWLWLDGTVALDPATQWDAFFDAAGAPRNLEPAGRVSLVPEVFLNAMPERFGLPLNRGRGGALAIPQGYVPA